MRRADFFSNTAYPFLRAGKALSQSIVKVWVYHAVSCHLLKSVLLFAFVLASGFLLRGHAQEGYKYAILKAGPVYQDAWSATAGIDFVTRYHNSFELSLSYYRHRSDYRNYLLGLFYKPVICRSKNTSLKLRMGTHVGTDNSDVILSALGGLELSQSLFPGLDLMVSATGGYYNRHHNWRVTGEAGFRISF